MQILYSLILTALLWPSRVDAQTDIYQDVNRLIGSQEWPKAQLQAQEHLKTRPTDPQMRLLLSRIQDGQGQTELAMGTLLALTQSFPELSEPHNNLAALLARQNRYTEALSHLQNAVRARPDYGTALENLGDVYIVMAIQAYQNAGKVLPPQPRIANKQRTAEQLLKPSP
jgi:tetratricopeptide (TPR) repeat protein